MQMTPLSPMAALLCRSSGRLCAIPLQHVGETMRALPVDPLPGMPQGVLGAAMVRGAVTPVLDLGSLIGATSSAGHYFVSLHVDGRSAVLAVDAVVGVVRLGEGELAQSPPLFGGADDGRIAAVGIHDAALMPVLRTARLLPGEGLP
jgi:purine-binding chemotaxis protein CheW